MSECNRQVTTAGTLHASKAVADDAALAEQVGGQRQRDRVDDRLLEHLVLEQQVVQLEAEHVAERPAARLVGAGDVEALRAGSSPTRTTAARSRSANPGRRPARARRRSVPPPPTRRCAAPARACTISSHASADAVGDVDGHRTATRRAARRRLSVRSRAADRSSSVTALPTAAMVRGAPCRARRSKVRRRQIGPTVPALWATRLRNPRRLTLEVFEQADLRSPATRRSRLRSSSHPGRFRRCEQLSRVVRPASRTRILCRSSLQSPTLQDASTPDLANARRAPLGPSAPIPPADGFQSPRACSRPTSGPQSAAGTHRNRRAPRIGSSAPSSRLPAA